MRIRSYLCLVLNLALLIPSASAQSVDPQALCHQAALQIFGEVDQGERVWSGGSKRISTEYESHYKTEVAKCFLFIETADMMGATPSTEARLFDLTTRYPDLRYAKYLKIAQYLAINGKMSSNEYVDEHRMSHKLASRAEFDLFVSGLMKD